MFPGVIVTVTATNPTATEGADGGVVVVTLTQSDPTTDAEGAESYIIAVSQYLT